MEYKYKSKHSMVFLLGVILGMLLMALLQALEII